MSSTDLDQIEEEKPSPPAQPSKASPEALAILGAFSAPEDVALMDDLMKLIHSDKEHQNAELLRV